MSGCSAPNCTNRAGNGKAFYAVPCGRTDVRPRLKWLLRTGRDRPAPKGTRICEAAEKTEEEEGTGATPDVYDSAVAALAKHFDTTCNLVVERHRFHRRIQFPGESIQEYVTALTELAAMCSFTSQEESLRDQFVAGRAKSSKSEREQVLERRLNLEEKRRRKVKKERDELRKSLGILDEVFIALKEKVALMNPSERHACVLMDEMQISPGLDYDASIGSIIASSFDAQQVKDCLFEVIQCAESAGVTVDAVVTDMGPGNNAIWRLCNIQATEYGKTKVSCPHPCGHNRQLYFIADVPHLRKNLRGHLVRGQDIILDAATVAKHALP
ncbi:hypothetical protein MTO96_012489 [Rhipicephalus appendiculatus]